jgi:hypothetical protein
MAGFNPVSRKKQSGYANGGMVRGPGSGISDDIKKKVAPGSYIMPADSTHEIGEEALQEMGEPKAEESKETLAGEKAETKLPEKGEPVNLSNGEYEMPPEQVHALGMQMLDMVKNATHTPVGKNARGFKPEPSFADGGGVKWDDTDKAKAAALAGGAAAYGTNAVLAPVAASLGTSPAQVAVGAIKEGINSVRNTEIPGMPQEALAKAGTVAALGATANDVWNTPTEDYRKRFGAETNDPSLVGDVGIRALGAASDLGNNMTLGLSGKYFQDKQAASVPSSSTGFKPAVQSLPSAAVPSATPSSSTPVTTDALATQPAATNNIKREMVNGVPSFSADGPIGDGFTINGQKPKMGMTVVPSSTFTDGNNPGAMQASGFRPAAQQESGPRLAVIGDNRQSNALQNKALSAASTAYEGSPNGQLTANQVKALVDMRNSDQIDATHRYTTDVNNQTAMDRVALTEQGANYRADTADQSANNRFAESNAIDKGRLGLETEAQGFKTRAAQREEKLYQKYEAAKTPEERSAIAESIRALSGKEEDPRKNYLETGGGQEWDANAGVMRNVGKTVINLKNGQVLGAEQQQQHAEVPQDKGAMVAGQTYQTARGPAKWDGKQFIKVQ